MFIKLILFLFRLETNLPWRLEYPNIHFRYLHLNRLFHGTPLGKFFFSWNTTWLTNSVHATPSVN